MTTGPNGSMDKVAAPQAMGSAARSDAVRRPRHRLVAGAAAGGALLMLCAAYAAVPIYKLICEATGMNGTTRRAERAPGVVSDARMRVRFNATVASGLPWDFKPAVAHVDVRLGETTLAHY